MKWMTLLVVTALGCGGGKKDDDKQDDKQVEKEDKKEDSDKKDDGDKKDDDSGGGLAGRFGSIADKAKEIAGDTAKEAADKAKEVGGDALDKAKELGDKAVDTAKAIDFEAKAREIGDEVARKAAGLSKEAVELGKKLKDAVIEKHKTKHDYDVSIDTVSDADVDKKIRGMKQLKVGDYAIGYQQYSTHPLGKVYNWKFQITWKLVTGQAVRLSLYTNEELHELALAAILADMVPAANLLLK